MFVYCTAQYNFNSTRENHLVDIIVFFHYNIEQELVPLRMFKQEAN